ncbi:MAG: hypothetical protein A2729_04570 [Candidatus Buchananbacteria bacterium RIFCSPHIGHO2_01_FULL_39_14]|uniref:Type II secretion system protein GspI C-terminal domain-containing protein n=2 Tax=Candidatus Buchananiibacteriota TaxID=1817903 RepID=A0A1G1YPN1_9BACT|nr:MAG: hypothetical protein A2729_04570 [Candidatus Buchananbacteria bacterium RIFCSPHIGHO2_01_FULL_39_14]OGY49263.1 MAG: hypothetical protein A3D39_03135 [Candidatus Buchananbacteria bacterium RIFCSPHIGHO2_02_FULL_39_17]OGY54323.1 MAG: hypothetical protein A2912_04795 [Candidatus Buchananbacteria bacterium RIFCSPLOWO2_01_FULL_40_23b]
MFKKSFIKIDKNNLRQHSAGFTIIEAAIATMILMVGLFAVVQIFPLSLKITGDAQRLTTASNLAVAKIEEVISLGYDNISTGTIEAKQRLSSDPTDFYYAFQRQTIVEYLDSNFNVSANDTGLKKITVTVFWPSTVGTSEKSTQLSSAISDF